MVAITKEIAADQVALVNNAKIVPLGPLQSRGCTIVVDVLHIPDLTQKSFSYIDRTVIDPSYLGCAYLKLQPDNLQRKHPMHQRSEMSCHTTLSASRSKPGSPDITLLPKYFLAMHDIGSHASGCPNIQDIPPGK